MINKEIDILTVPIDLFLQRLLMTALLAKKCTSEEDDIKVFEIFLSHNYPMFMQSFAEW